MAKLWTSYSRYPPDRERGICRIHGRRLKMVLWAGYTTSRLSKERTDAGFKESERSTTRWWNFVVQSTAIIRMIRFIFLRLSRSYSSVEQDDLWMALEQAYKNAGGSSLGNKTVKQVMDTWTLQPNCPLIRVYRNASKSLRVTQVLFQHRLLLHELGALYYDILLIYAWHQGKKRTRLGEHDERQRHWKHNARICAMGDSYSNHHGCLLYTWA